MICAKNKRLIIKKICLEFIKGVSFFEVNIRIPQHNKISRKSRIVGIAFKFWNDWEFSSYEDKTAIAEQTIKIRVLSNVLILIGFLDGNWLLFHRYFDRFNSLVRFCTEYK